MNQPPPSNLEAERSVLGCMMFSDRAVDDVLSVLNEQHFYTETHQRIFAAIRDLSLANKGVDTVTLAKELGKRKHLEDCGGPAYLIQVMESVPHAAHAEYYAQIVKELSDRRQCIVYAEQILKAAYDQSSDTDSVIGSIEQSITSLVESRAAGTPSIDIGSILLEAVARLEAGTTIGMKAGYGPLDEKSTGMHAGQLIVVGARPRVGKSAFALNVARNVAMRGSPVLFVTLEMPAMELAERLLSLEAAISLYDMRTGRLSEQDTYELTEASNRLAGLPIRIEDANVSLLQLSAIARREKRRRSDLGLVIIDYLQLIDARDPKMVREQQIAEVTRGLKNLAKSLGVPIMLLAQLNREVDKRHDNRPKLSDLRESGAIEQDADQVWLLHRPALYMDPASTDYTACQYQADIDVAKNRNGPSGKVTLEFQETLMRFRAEEIALPEPY